MVSATSRALELLELMESAGIRSARELADRLNLDERSVRRHIERLRELGIPVETVRGPGGGYRIASSFRLPPLMFSEEEAVALLAGLTVARGGVNQLAASSALATAIAKVQRSLPKALAERVSALLDVVVGAERAGDETDPTIVLTAADAIRSRRPVALRYRSAERSSQRTVQPHDLVAYNGRWYLTGLDSLGRERRVFRLDRVASLRALDGSFAAPLPRDALGDLVRGFATAPHRYTVRLRIQAAPDWIERHLPPSVATLERLPGQPASVSAPATGSAAPGSAVTGTAATGTAATGSAATGSAAAARSAERGDAWFRAIIHAESLEWLPRILLALDRPVIIDEPDELRVTLINQAAKLTRIASASVPALD
ncbi:helix-turn-helix transcriptional regulator [Subtercola lobariae]|uniref:Transcriptional regulator n=1 Tax=Subtercola lobariae TaxID=1588641 RepID=A0A917B7K6_9MICO|nr:WYL domain-containing protein [Subtercola lobariae]GGF27783.1 transcriptional regulator [Subtercola lobariae]